MSKENKFTRIFSAIKVAKERKFNIQPCKIKRATKVALCALLNEGMAADCSRYRDQPYVIAKTDPTSVLIPVKLRNLTELSLNFILQIQNLSTCGSKE